MEDDVVLGPDFGLHPGVLREADELFPHTGIVSFFSGTFGEPGWSIHSMEDFGWLQCAGIRNADYFVSFRTFIDDLVTRSAGQQFTTFPDVVVRTFLAAQYDTFALWCPSLVQHAEVTSAFFSQTEDAPKRISRSYRQAYG